MGILIAALVFGLVLTKMQAKERSEMTAKETLIAYPKLWQREKYSKMERYYDISQNRSSNKFQAIQEYEYFKESLGDIKIQKVVRIEPLKNGTYTKTKQEYYVTYIEKGGGKGYRVFVMEYQPKKGWYICDQGY